MPTIYTIQHPEHAARGTRPVPFLSKNEAFATLKEWNKKYPGHYLTAKTVPPGNLCRKCGLFETDGAADRYCPECRPARNPRGNDNAPTNYTSGEIVGAALISICTGIVIGIIIACIIL